MELMGKVKFILASASPRRREILDAVGIKYEVRPTEADETIPDDCANDAEKTVCMLSKRKADAASHGGSNEIIIAADTVVFAGGEILGKPTDVIDAARMLKTLSGKTHSVLTGITVKRGEKTVTEFEKSFVTFLPLTDEQIHTYIKLKNPLDKAGAYGIQETAALFVSEIKGDYHNIVGLPICRLGEILRREFAVELVCEIE
jgi:MAF protein